MLNWCRLAVNSRSKALSSAKLKSIDSGVVGVVNAECAAADVDGVEGAESTGKKSLGLRRIGFRLSTTRKLLFF